MFYLENLEELLPKQIWDMIQGFLPTYRKYLEEKEASIEGLVNEALFRGLEEMLIDIIGSDPEILKNSYLRMFEENPTFIGKFVAQALDKGETIEKEEKEEIKNKWMRARIYI